MRGGDPTNYSRLSRVRLHSKNSKGNTMPSLSLSSSLRWLMKFRDRTYWDSFKHEMWRFVIPGQIIAQYLPSFVEYPPMQAGGSFSIGDLKEKVEAAIKASQAGAQARANDVYGSHVPN
jgi:hypothetical protein